MSKPLVNEVIYSESRANTLRACPRRFWYQVYASWGGWWYGNKPPVSRRAEEAYNAKFADNQYSLVGKIIHEQAKWAIEEARKGRKWDREVLRNVLLKNAKDAIDNGLKQAMGTGRGSPKRRVQLVEVSMEMELDEAWIRQKTASGIRALTSADDRWSGSPLNLFVRALTVPDRVVLVDDVVTHKIGGVTSFVAMDLVMRSAHDPNDCVILDWKTGKTKDSHSEQVHQYAAWAYNRGWKNVSLYLVYLGDGSATVHQVNAEADTSVKAAEQKVAEFIDSLRPRLVNGDLEMNKAIEARFEPTSDARECRLCPFQRMCARDGTKPPSDGGMDLTPDA